MNKKIKRWVLVLLWVILIFVLSHQPELKSDLPGGWDFLLRKLAHISEYVILTLLLVNALKEYGLSRKKILFLAISLSFLYALSDEYHQSFISGRDGAFRDVLIDSLGIFLAAWLKNKKMIKYN